MRPCSGVLTVYIEKAEGLSARMHDAGFTRNMSVGSGGGCMQGQAVLLAPLSLSVLVDLLTGRCLPGLSPLALPGPLALAHACSKVKVSVGEVSKVTERSKVALLHRRDPVFNER